MKTAMLAIFDDGGDWRAYAQRSGVSESTAYRWVAEGNKPDLRGGRTYSKVNNVHKTFMIQEIEMNNRITLAMMKDKLESKFNLILSKEGIRIHLDSLLYTLKKIRFEPERANSLENKVKRREFAESLMRYRAENRPIIFMDETNYNMHVSRSQGRSLRGTRCSTIAASSKGANVSIIGAIGHRGLIYHEIVRGSFTKDRAQEWFRCCLRRAKEVYGSGVVMVIDNAPCHNGLETVFQEDEFLDHTLLRLAPYSPMLNPSENLWSYSKSYIKRELAENGGLILEGAERGRMSITEFRAQYLMRLGEEALSSVTAEMCSKFYCKN